MDMATLDFYFPKKNSYLRSCMGKQEYSWDTHCKGKSMFVIETMPELR